MGCLECIILIRHSRTVFNQSNHEVFLNFSVSLFISLISALNLPHQYLADNKVQHSFIILTNFEQSFDHRVCVKKQMELFRGFPAELAFSRGSRCTDSIRIIFLLTGLRIYTGEHKAQGPTLCPTEGRALRGPRALYSPV